MDEKWIFKDEIHDDDVDDGDVGHDVGDAIYDILNHFKTQEVGFK
jgi:hypothetical protein